MRLQENATPDLGEWLMHHLRDGKEIELEILGRGWVWHLPQWEPFHIGALELDLSPTKHGVFLLVAAILLLLVFIPTGYAMRKRDTDSAPGGRPNERGARVVGAPDAELRWSVGDRRWERGETHANGLAAEEGSAVTPLMR